MTASATAALLWAACRPEPDRAGVADALAAGADVERAAGVAVAQRVGPLFWRALEGCQRSSHEAPWARDLRLDSMHWRIKAMRLLPQAVSAALTPLHSAGLEPLVLKGAALVGRYPEPRLRPMDDVDLLVPPTQYREALAVLRDAGWCERPQLGRHHHEALLAHPDLPGLPIEVHRLLATWREASDRLSGVELWKRRRPQVVEGVAAFGLDPEDELVLVASHAGKPFHVFGRLLWAVDLAVVIDSAETGGQPIDWERVAGTATEARCRTAVAVGLTHALRLGAASPDFVRESPAAGARRRALEPVLSADWPLLDRDAGIRTRLRYAFSDSRRHRLLLFAGAATADGVLRAPRRAVASGGRAVRRWWRLRTDLGS